MQAVQLATIGAPLIDATVPDPEPGPGEVLVKVKAAGICHSDAHYRSGLGKTAPLPLTLGHEVAGEVSRLGAGVMAISVGDRVALDYLVTCGDCDNCRAGGGQFCDRLIMLGKDGPGGYAEYIIVPASNCVILPPAIAFSHGAVMMCAYATALHALNRTRLQPGESVAVIGVGGLGLAAVQIAIAKGAGKVLAIDIQAHRLELAASYGAVPINAGDGDVAGQAHAHAGGSGVNLVLDFVARPDTITTAIKSLAPKGRVGLIGISREEVPLSVYNDLIGREAELIGVSDHTPAELQELVDMASAGEIDPSPLVAQTVPLEAQAINRILDALERHEAPVRTVVVI